MTPEIDRATKCDTAVLLLGFGGPETLDQVRPFIEKVVAGRNVPAARVDAVVEQYKEIGGKSPFNELTRRQAKALEKQLEQDKHAMPVKIGLLYSSPTIEQAVEEITACGARSVVVIVLATHRTEASFERYTRALDEALDKVQAATIAKLQIALVESWHLHPLFVEAAAERVITTLDKLTQDELDYCRLLFTAHSIPQEMSDRSGYDEQVQASSAAVASRVRGRTGRNMPWAVSYQSRSGPPTQPWLEPDIQHELAVCKKQGKEHVVVAPIGFLCDHVEVLFDLDVLAARTARELGMSFLRAPTVGDHPTFIRLLAELAAAKAESFYAKPDRQ